MNEAMPFLYHGILWDGVCFRDLLLLPPICLIGTPFSIWRNFVLRTALWQITQNMNTLHFPGHSGWTPRHISPRRVRLRSALSLRGLTGLPADHKAARAQNRSSGLAGLRKGLENPHIFGSVVVWWGGDSMRMAWILRDKFQKKVANGDILHTVASAKWVA